MPARIVCCSQGAARCAFLGVFLLLTACGEYTLVSKEGSEYLLEGQQLRYARNDAEAEKMFRQAYASSDQLVKSEAAFQLAQLAKTKAQHDETLQYLEEAFAAGYGGSPVRLAKAYMDASPALRDYDKAEKILQQHKNESADAALSLAGLYMMRQQPGKAMSATLLAEEMYNYSENPARDALQIARTYRDIYLHPSAVYPQAGKKAKQWYHTAMERGETRYAPVEMAQVLMYKAAPGSRTFQEGMASLEQAALQNNPEAMETLGKVYYDMQNNEKALYWFSRRERLGDPTGTHAYQIAKVYRRSKDNPAHLALMEAWYEKAIARQNPEAIDSWRKYQVQEQIKQVARAQKLKEKRARQAQKEELRQLTTLTPDDEKGFALLLEDKQEEQAYRHFKLLADNGKSLHAMLMVDSWQGKKAGSHTYASTYQQAGPQNLYRAISQNAGQLGEAHTEQIMRQWALGAAYGSGDAAYKLAQYYEQSQSQQAEEWFAKAARMGSGKALLRKAREVTVNSEGKQADQQAFSWYRKAAEAGEAEGQYQTGMMYAKGKGVAKNLQQARYWLNKAKNNGYKLASDAIASIE